MNSHLFFIHKIPHTFIDILSAWDSDTVLLIILLLLLVIWLLPEKNTTEQTDRLKASSDTEDTAYDYDFLANHESTDAQFDLVIAYATMDHKDKALALLEQLHLSTHAPTRERAGKMLDTLKTKWNIS